MNRNQHCLNSYDFRFLDSMKERNPVRIQENQKPSTNV